MNRRKIYHNDFHPRNFIINHTENGWQAWIIDLGKAASTEQGNQGGDLILPQQIWHYKTSETLQGELQKEKEKALEEMLLVATQKCPHYLDQLKKSPGSVAFPTLYKKFFAFSPSRTAEQITESLSQLVAHADSRNITLDYIHQALKNEQTPGTILKSCKAVLAALYQNPSNSSPSSNAWQQAIDLKKRLVENLTLAEPVESIVQNVFPSNKDPIKFPALLIALSRIDQMAVLQYIYQGFLSMQLMGPYTEAFTKITAEVDKGLFSQAKNILSAPPEVSQKRRKSTTNPSIPFPQELSAHHNQIPPEVSEIIVNAALKFLEKPKKGASEEEKNIYGTIQNEIRNSHLSKKLKSLLTKDPIGLLEKLPTLSQALCDANTLDAILPHIFADMIRQNLLTQVGGGSQEISLSFKLSELSPWQQKMLGFYAVGKISINDAKFKIFKPGGMAQNEFQMQKLATTILQKRGGLPPDARASAFVPAVYFFKKMDIANLGIKLPPKLFGETLATNLELICGEYVPGIDLATFLYRLILKKMREQGLYQLYERVDSLPFNDLQTHVANALKIGKPGEKTSAALFNHRIAHWLVTADEKINIQLPNIWEPLKELGDYLHKENLYHNNMHYGNLILIPGVPDKYRVALIDFAMASNKNAETDIVFVDSHLGFHIRHVNADLRKQEGIQQQHNKRNEAQQALEKLLQEGNALPHIRRLQEGLDKNDKPINMPDKLPAKLRKVPSNYTTEDLIRSLSVYAFSNRLDALTYIFCTLNKKDVDFQVPAPVTREYKRECKAVLLALYPRSKLESILNTPRDSVREVLPGLDRGYLCNEVMSEMTDKFLTVEGFHLQIVKAVAKIDPIAAMEYVFAYSKIENTSQAQAEYRAIVEILDVPETLVESAKQFLATFKEMTTKLNKEVTP